jgi:hypothetical protein
VFRGHTRGPSLSGSSTYSAVATSTLDPDDSALDCTFEFFEREGLVVDNV